MNGAIQKIQTIDRVITLPKTIQKSWKGRQASISYSDDTIVVKRLQRPSFWDTWERLRSVSEKISKKDINDAIRWARRKR